MLPSEITGIAPATLAATEKKNELGQEDFLRMLIAQLENQDPLNPQDATEFSAQLAQFSSLEQLIGMRAAIDDLAAAQGSSEVLAAAGLIGRQVLAETTDFEIPLEGEGPTLYVDVPDGAEVFGVDLVDRNGRVVSRANSLGTLQPGLQEIAWEEFSPAVPPGTYSVRLEQAAGQTALATPLVQARVTGASVSGATPVLMLGEAIVPLAGIREVRE
jgi:flagellar basal-body rod modification protein FlgD